MGWTYFYANGEKDKKELMTHELERYGSTKVLKCSMSGGVYYAACTDNRHPGEVYGIVCVTSLKQGEFGYKDMAEEMGPCYHDCPTSIIEMLTPTNDKYAIEWRSECIVNAASKGQNVAKAISAMPLGSKLVFDQKTWIKVSPTGERKDGAFVRAQ